MAAPSAGANKPEGEWVVGDGVDLPADDDALDLCAEDVIVKMLTMYHRKLGWRRDA